MEAPGTAREIAVGLQGVAVASEARVLQGGEGGHEVKAPVSLPVTSQRHRVDGAATE